MYVETNKRARFLILRNAERRSFMLLFGKQKRIKEEDYSGNSLNAHIHLGVIACACIHFHFEMMVAPLLEKVTNIFFVNIGILKSS